MYGTLKEPIKACFMGLRLAELKAVHQQNASPVPILQLDEVDKCANPVEIMGEMSICRYLMSQCAWPTPDLLSLDEWMLYTLKPITESVSKSQVKNNQSVLEAIAQVESNVSGKFIGGNHPCSSDLLSFAYLYHLFSGNAWMLKKFPKLGESFKALAETYNLVQEDLGQKVASAKKKQEVKFFSENVKIARDKSKIVLPESGKKNVLITSALPYVNNVPHLGNIIGCVLSADVYARYCRLRGYNTVYICGTDEYGTATETKALQEGLTPKEICDKYHEIHKRIYDWFDIDFDYFGRTTTQQQTDIAQEIFMKLYNNKQLFEEDVEQSYCTSCSKFLADRFVRGNCPFCNYEDARGDQCDSCGKLVTPEELVSPRCYVCNSTPERRTSRHVFLNLPNIKDRLENWIQESSQKGRWSSNCLKTTFGWIRDGLKPRCITRDLKWGTPVPLAEFAEKVFYVWFDAPIGYLSITANYTRDWERWWKDPNSDVDLVMFMGKDNVPFHTVIFPSTLIATDEPYKLLNKISTTEYLNYEAGKFSKSRGSGVFGDDAIETGIPCEIYRYYLLSNRPETSDTIFKWSDLAERTNNELLPNLGNLCNRVLQFIGKLDRELGEPGDISDHDYETLTSIYETIKRYCEEMEELKIREALKTAMEVSASVNKYLQDSKLWELKKQDPQKFNTTLIVAVNLLRATGALLEPFIPSFSAKLYSQLGIHRSERDEKLLEYLMQTSDPKVLLTLLEPSTKVVNPAPIIRAISAEQVNTFKEKFAGSNN